MKKPLIGKPKKPRGRPFKAGNKCSPGRPKLNDAERRAQKDARLIARDASPEAVERQIEIMRGVVTIEGPDGKPVKREAKISEMLMAPQPMPG